MKITKVCTAISLALLISTGVHASIDFISYDKEALSFNKSDISGKQGAYDALIKKADKALNAEIDPVTNKTLLPASGDIHDYFSFGPYWWPNPDTEDGLPYVRRDGEYNMATKTKATDKQRFIRFANDVKDLGLAYYFSDNQNYADKAIAQLDAWFVNPKTRMNPNLNHAQAIPGAVDGRGIGIIESRLLIPVLDSVNILKEKMTSEQYDAVVSWIDEFNHWMLTSQNGFEEDNWHNNHGTWYDAQVVAFSLFVDKPEIAQKRLQITQMRRIGSQFNIEGAQHGELERTRPWHYSNFNLEAYSLLGHFGEKVDVDVWNYEVDKHALSNGYRFVAKYVNNPDQWQYNDLKGFDGSKAYSNILYANRAYDDAQIKQALATLQNDESNKNKVENLLFK
jgi:hypothetical protein